MGVSGRRSRSLTATGWKVRVAVRAGGRVCANQRSLPSCQGSPQVRRRCSPGAGRSLGARVEEGPVQHLEVVWQRRPGRCCHAELTDLDRADAPDLAARVGQGMVRRAAGVRGRGVRSARRSGLARPNPNGQTGQSPHRLLGTVSFLSGIRTWSGDVGQRHEMVLSPVRRRSYQSPLLHARAAAN